MFALDFFIDVIKCRQLHTYILILYKQFLLSSISLPRTIHFFDASASVHYEEYRGFGLKNIPVCMEFWHEAACPDGPALLMFGDDGGGLTVIT
jgi:hypothetical protein